MGVVMGHELSHAFDDQVLVLIQFKENQIDCCRQKYLFGSRVKRSRQVF